MDTTVSPFIAKVISLYRFCPFDLMFSVPLWSVPLDFTRLFLSQGALSSAGNQRTSQSLHVGVEKRFEQLLCWPLPGSTEACARTRILPAPFRRPRGIAGTNHFGSNVENRIKRGTWRSGNKWTSSKAVSREKTSRARPPCLRSRSQDEELSSSHSCKFHMCGTVAVDPSQETANDLRQLRFLEHMEDPVVIDAGILEYLTLVERTQHVPRQLSLPRKCYPSSAWTKYISEMDVSSHGVPLKASANHHSENLAVAITQRQRTQCLRRSHNTAIVIDIGGFGNKHSSVSRQTAPELGHLQSRACTHKTVVPSAPSPPTSDGTTRRGVSSEERRTVWSPPCRTPGGGGSCRRGASCCSCSTPSLLLAILCPLWAAW